MSFIKIILFSCALGLGVKWLAFESFTVPTESMSPTIKVGSKVWVLKLPFTPNRHDIIAFKKDGENFVKRITGIPSEKVLKKTGKFSLLTEGVADTNVFYSIPKKGETIVLNNQNFDFYRPLIENYEHIQAGKLLDKIYINAKESNSYTFTQNYYFVQGDNTSDSVDSRQFGLIPEMNFIGKILFIK